MSSKKPTNEHTSARVASTAAKLLSNPRTTASVKSVAASALTQRATSSKAKGKSSLLSPDFCSAPKSDDAAISYGTDDSNTRRFSCSSTLNPSESFLAPS